LLKADTTLNEPVVGVSLVVVTIVILFLMLWLLSAVEHHMPYPIRRTIGILISLGLMVSCTAIFFEDTNFFRFSLAAYYAIGAMSQLGLLLGVSKCFSSNMPLLF
jgi:glucan phosphoethanolaminetransferase (alkaline phosphatase superfamily)